MQKIEIPVHFVGQAVSKAKQPIVDPSSRGNGLRVAVKTMGCKVNSFESELISESLGINAFNIVDVKEKADCYIVNTCTVTNEADRQARQEVRKLVRVNPDAFVVVTGCYAQMDPQAVSNIPGVDLVVGNDKKLDINILLPKLIAQKLPKVMVGDLDKQISLPSMLLSSYENQTRAFVQIQQGCDQGCTFCIIHRARGPSRSIEKGVIKRQVERLVLNGFAEIVLCGVDLGAYGDDFDNRLASEDLVSLIRTILTIKCDEQNPFRIRLSSIDPAHISDELIQLISDEKRICPHLHLSLQSGSTLILKRMKRRYNREHVIERIQRLRALLPNLVLSADVMVGFPTESDEDFQQTKSLVEDLRIAFPHVFSYSDRQGTPASRIPQAKHCGTELKKNRNKSVRSIGKGVLEQVLQSRIGQIANVLPERKSKQAGYWLCRAEEYLSVLVPESHAQRGQWLQVQYIDIQGTQLIAKVH